jgi:hypothetical protein
MAGPGRNSRCPCGSGRKVKHCCGEHKGPSDERVARAYVATEARPAARHLRRHLDNHDEFDDLIDEAAELPTSYAELSVPLPRLTTPDMQRLRDGLRSWDRDGVTEVLPRIVAACDSWAVRADLVRAVRALEADGEVSTCVAAAAVVDLSVEESELLRMAVFAAVAVDAGVVDTLSGLRVAAG